MKLKNAERDAKMFELVMSGMTMTDIAKSHGITSSRVAAIIQKMIRMMVRQISLDNEKIPFADDFYLYQRISEARKHSTFWLQHLEKWKNMHIHSLKL